MAQDYTKTTLNYPQGADTPIKRVIVNRPPKTGTVDSDYKNFIPGDEWLDTSNYDWWKFVRVAGSPPIGTWILLGTGNLESLTGNVGGPVPPDGANNINVIGSGIVNVTGNPGTNTLTITSSGSGFLTGNVGGPVPPDGASNTNIVGVGGVTVTGNPGTNTLSISVSNLGAIFWQVIVANQMAVKDNGYFTLSGAPIQITLPAVSAVGDTFEVADIGGGLFQIVQGAGQQIRLGTQTTPLGVGHSLTSAQDGAHLQFVCYAANMGWMAMNPNGNFILV